MTPIIIKRPKIVKGDGHHGGAWKVAYADFVTAMMAFFLLMWLLNATTEEQRKGLADYFNPSIPIASVSGGGRNALNGDTITSQNSMTKVSRIENVKQVDEERPVPEVLDGEVAATTDSETEVQDHDAKVIEALQEAMAERSPELAEHVNLRLSPDGLVIELTDRANRPLFQSGSAAASPLLTRLAAVVADALEDVENPIKIAGHTDSANFAASSRYSNWELSTDRANVARRLIVGSGLSELRIKEVTGKAATVPLVDDPGDPRNRRISLTLVSDRAS